MSKRVKKARFLSFFKLLVVIGIGRPILIECTNKVIIIIIIIIIRLIKLYFLFLQKFLNTIHNKFNAIIIIIVVFHQLNFFLTKAKCSSFLLKEIVNSVLIISIITII